MKIKISILFFIDKLDLNKKIKFLKLKLNKAIVLLVLFSILSIQPASAFLHDLEITSDNTFSAGSLVVGMRSGQNNFVSDPLDLEPGDVVTRDVYVQKTGSLDYKYKSEYEFISGDEELCQNLELKVWYNWYDALPSQPNYHANRHMDLKYNGLLSNFSDFDTNSPTHDPDMQLLNTHDYFNNIFYADNEHWFYYKIILPADTGYELQNLSCNFNIKTTGWQTNFSDETQGFVDSTTIESTVVTDNWHSRSVSGLKFDDQNNNNIKEITEPGLENWTIQAGRLVEEHDILANNATPIATSLLEAGKEYVFRVNGIFSAGDNITADAKYSVRFPNTHWTDEVQNYESYGSNLLDLQIDGSSPDWGKYNPDHVYWLPVSGSDAVFSLLINDIYYSNNTGSLHLEIYEVVATTTTVADGTYNLDLSGQLGDLIIFEVWQEGWRQTLPDVGGYYPVTDVLVTTDQNFGNYLYEMQETNDIVLNELLYDPVGADSGTIPDGEYAELYNNTGTDIDAAGWTIENELNNSVTITTSNSDNDLDTADVGETIVPAGSYLVVYLGQNDFMTNDGDTISLIDASAILQDRHTYTGGKPEGNTEARIPDGTGNWVDPVATPGRSNVFSVDDLEPMIRIWQQEPYNAKLSLFDALNYDTATYELSYSHQVQEGDLVVDVIGMLIGEVEIDEIREDKIHLYFATCSAGGICIPHRNVDPDSINLKMVLQGEGLPERTLEVGLTGEWLEEEIR